jgi:hypothetical protein
VDGLARLRSAGQFAPDWVLGGGTALMIHTGHRISKDIDAFIEDPQYLSFLSPRLAGEDIWAYEAYEESANHLKLIFPEGEIDFIVAARLTDLASDLKTIDLSGIAAGASHKINVEHPVETRAKIMCARSLRPSRIDEELPQEGVEPKLILMRGSEGCPLFLLNTDNRAAKAFAADYLADEKLIYG